MDNRVPLQPLNTDPYPCPLQDQGRGNAGKVRCIRENFLARQAKHPQGVGYLTEEESVFLLDFAGICSDAPPGLGGTDAPELVESEDEE